MSLWSYMLNEVSLSPPSLLLLPPPRPGTCSSTCTLIQEVGQQAAQDSLMADDQHVLLPLKLHDHWLKALDQVLVGLNKEGQDITLEQRYLVSNPPGRVMVFYHY